MTAAQRRWTCPKCKKKSPRSHPRTKTRICTQCKALVQVNTQEVIHSAVGYFPVQHTFQVGKKYDFPVSGRQDNWLVLGIVNMAEGDDLWDEILLVNRSGDEVWVSHSEGEVYAHQEIDHPSFVGLLDSPSEIKGRIQLEYQDVRFSRDSEGIAYIRGMTGAFTEKMRLKDQVGYWEGYDPDDEDCLSVTWNEGKNSHEDPPVSWSYGTWVELSQLTKKNRISPKASAGHVGGTRAILILGIIAIIYLITTADGSVSHSGYIKPQGQIDVQSEIKYRSKSMRFARGEMIDIGIHIPNQFFPLRLSAQLISASSPSSDANQMSTSKSDRSAQLTSIKLNQEEYDPLTGLPQPRLLKYGMGIDATAMVKKSGYYVLEIKAKSEKHASALKSVDVQTSSASNSESESNSYTSMGYSITTGAYKPSLLVWALFLFVTLLFKPINLWFFGWLNKLFRLG